MGAAGGGRARRGVTGGRARRVGHHPRGLWGGRWELSASADAAPSVGGPSADGRPPWSAGGCLGRCRRADVDRGRGGGTATDRVRRRGSRRRRDARAHSDPLRRGDRAPLVVDAPPVFSPFVPSVALLAFFRPADGHSQRLACRFRSLAAGGPRMCHRVAMRAIFFGGRCLEMAKKELCAC